MIQIRLLHDTDILECKMSHLGVVHESVKLEKGLVLEVQVISEITHVDYGTYTPAARIGDKTYFASHGNHFYGPILEEWVTVLGE